MTKQQYSKYEAAVDHNLKGLHAISTGACPSCPDCGLGEDCSDHDRELAEESSFSWSECESCGSTLGGNRHPAHALDKENRLYHLMVCEDCLYYLNYGQLDDMTMMDMEKA